MILGFLKNASVQLATIQGTSCSTSTIKALSGQSTVETFQVPALINFGLGPYFTDILLSQIKASSFFVNSYDESVNKILQNEQMDCCVRFWDSNSSEVCSRYLDSKFLLHPNLKNLSDKLVDATKSLDLSKLPQPSMDGPNVN